MGQMLPKKGVCIDFNFTIWANGMISLLTIRFPWNTLPGQGSTDKVSNPNGCRMSVESMIDQKTLNFGFLLLKKLLLNSSAAIKISLEEIAFGLCSISLEDLLSM